MENPKPAPPKPPEGTPVSRRQFCQAVVPLVTTATLLALNGCRPPDVRSAIFTAVPEPPAAKTPETGGWPEPGPVYTTTSMPVTVREAGGRFHDEIGRFQLAGIDVGLKDIKRELPITTFRKGLPPAGTAEVANIMSGRAIRCTGNISEGVRNPGVIQLRGHNPADIETFMYLDKPYRNKGANIAIAARNLGDYMARYGFPAGSTISMIKAAGIRESLMAGKFLTGIATLADGTTMEDEAGGICAVFTLAEKLRALVPEILETVRATPHNDRQRYWSSSAQGADATVFVGDQGQGNIDLEIRNKGPVDVYLVPKIQRIPLGLPLPKDFDPLKHPDAWVALSLTLSREPPDTGVLSINSATVDDFLGRR